MWALKIKIALLKMMPTEPHNDKIFVDLNDPGISRTLILCGIREKTISTY